MKNVTNDPSEIKVDQYSLNDSERRILRLLCLGMSNKAIAQQLGRCPQSISNRLVSIYKKIGVRTRTEAALRYEEIV